MIECPALRKEGDTIVILIYAVTEKSHLMQCVLALLCYATFMLHSELMARFVPVSFAWNTGIPLLHKMAREARQTVTFCSRYVSVIA